MESTEINFEFLERRVSSAAGVDRAYALVDLADAFYGSGQFPHCLAAITAAVDLFVEYGGEGEAVAHCKRQAGCTLAELERWDEAIASMEEAKALYMKLDMNLGVATAERLLGQLHFALGRLALALSHFQSAKHAFRAEESDEDAAECAFEAAEIYSKLEDFDCALVEYQIAEKWSKQAGWVEMEANSAFQMATLLLSLERFAEAAKAFRRAKRGYRATGIKQFADMCTIALAECKAKLAS